MKVLEVQQRDYRDKLENLKDDIRNGKVKNIWCLERSRMFRDSYESMEFRVQLSR